VLYDSRHRQKVRIVNMIRATGMRNTTWSTVATLVVESHLVPTEVAGNLFTLPYLADCHTFSADIFFFVCLIVS